jgi:hypothetical protein
METTGTSWEAVACPHLIAYVPGERAFEEQRGFFRPPDDDPPDCFLAPDDYEDIEPDALREALSREAGVVPGEWWSFAPWSWDELLLETGVERAAKETPVAVASDEWASQYYWAKEPTRVWALVEDHAERCAQIAREAPRFED